MYACIGYLLPGDYDTKPSVTNLIRYLERKPFP